jgi:hypothetical protein
MSNTRLAKIAFLLAIGVQLAACSSSDERSLVLVDVRLGSGALAPEFVHLSAMNAGAEVKTADPAWTPPASNTLSVGLFIPAGVTGPVTIAAQGHRGGAIVLEGALAQAVTLKVGGSVGPFELVLAKAVVPPTEYDAGVDAGNVEVGGAEAGGFDGHSPDLRAAEVGSGEVVNPVDVALPDATDLPLPSDTADVNPVQPDAPPALPDGSTDTANAVDAAQAPSWEPARNVENDTFDTTYSPKVVVDPISENVYLAWTESTAVKVKRWTRTTATWEKTVTVETRGEPRDTAIGADAKGNVILVWCQYLRDAANANLAGIWASRTSDGLTWGSPVRVASLPALNVVLAVARNGTARAIYQKEIYDPSQSYPLFSAYFDGTSWTENLAPLEPTDSNSASQDPELVVSENGDGVAIFDSDQATINIAAVTFAGQTVSAPIAVNPGDLDLLYGDRTIAMNRKGEAVFVWSGGTTSKQGLHARTYSPKLGWSSASPEINTASGMYEIVAALDEQGDVTIAWQQSTMSGTNMMGIHGSVAGSWSDITLLENDNKATYLMDHFGRPKMAIDGSGNVLVVWRKDQSTSETNVTYGAYASGFSNGRWLPQFKLGQITGLDVPEFSLSVSDKGLGAVSYVYISDWTTSEADAYNAMVALYR